MFHASKPGSLDTSLVSTDNIDNPRTMNAIYYLKPRLDRALLAGKETLAGGSLNNRQFNEFVKPDDPQLGWLTKFFQAPDTVWSPRVLKDGSDSVGGLGALNRVYLNIGLFSEEWLLHFNALVGGKRTTPIKIADARKNSTYWVATEAQTVDMALFFLKSTDPHKLKDAPGGDTYKPEQTKLAQGKKIFADYCARCHSSKMPPIPSTVRDPGVCSGKPLHGVLGQLLAMDQDRGFPEPDGKDRRERRFPDRQFPGKRIPRAGDVASNQRLQPTRHQRDPRQHLGQLLVAKLTRTFHPWEASPGTTP